MSSISRRAARTVYDSIFEEKTLLPWYPLSRLLLLGALNCTTLPENAFKRHERYELFMMCLNSMLVHLVSSSVSFQNFVV